MKVTSLQGDPVDLVVWRERGTVDGLVEAVLDTNRGLAARGVVLPIGTTVTLPDPPASPVRKPTVKLWD
ncbi:Uncharacterised protein [Starkeya nomas]|uniref:Phage tail protein X n=1 Tax=Starkeya nomas TaxID=2666134 RepID=A0A5S9R5Y0_9HYPH|nr:tail protein X [Starkeya nomas]CAA0129023.1 Uncharacterised protein [Starkeya nomas]